MTVKISLTNHPHRVSVPWRSTGQWRDLQIWLIDNVGYYNNYVFVGVDTYNGDNRVYYFAHEKDATMFALRWS